MVGAVKRWLGIDVLERENLRLAKACKSLDSAKEKDSHDYRVIFADFEARIAFFESRLTPKPSEAKIVPRPHKTTFRQFAEAASKATEEIEA